MKYLLNDLTPVEKVGGIYFKREDLFQPFSDSEVNGSKLRQCMLLVDKNKGKINNGIITATSVLSPQAPMVARVAKEYGVNCDILYGGTSFEKLSTNKYYRLSKDYGAIVSIVSKSGRQSVLQHHAQKIVDETNKFNIMYGMDLENNIDVFIDSIAKQVENLPDNLDNLIIPCGSGISTIGILTGINMYKKNIKNIYAIGIAPNRLDKINKFSDKISNNYNIKFDNNLIYVDAFSTLKGYKYENVCHENYFGIEFHKRYESKVFKWLINNIDYDKEKTCMWIVGKDI